MHRALRGPRPLVFAHRGGAKIGPENTLEAFDRGVAAGADGLEFDVRLSRDADVVVVHDPRVDRTTNARGAVSAYTADELARLDAAHHYREDGGWPLRGRGVGIPTLRHVLARYPQHVMLIELKESTPELAHRVVDAIHEAKALDRVEVGSYSRTALRAIRRSEPRLPTGSSREETRLALYATRVGLAPHWAGYRAFQVPERARGSRIVSQRFVRLAHEAELVVQVWTVDEPDDMRRLLSWGVDAIISDRPDVAVRTISEWARTPAPRP
jgi:glycerophosphoryl diester phosphodiesterase